MESVGIIYFNKQFGLIESVGIIIYNNQFGLDGIGRNIYF